MTNDPAALSPDRLQCCIPGCRRTRRADGVFDEWICGDHWRAVDKAQRQAYGRYTKRWRRFRSRDTLPAERRLWAWVKRRAIECAVGIR